VVKIEALIPFLQHLHLIVNAGNGEINKAQGKGHWTPPIGHDHQLVQTSRKAIRFLQQERIKMQANADNIKQWFSPVTFDNLIKSQFGLYSLVIYLSMKFSFKPRLRLLGNDNLEGTFGWGKRRKGGSQNFTCRASSAALDEYQLKKDGQLRHLIDDLRSGAHFDNERPGMFQLELYRFTPQNANVIAFEVGLHGAPQQEIQVTKYNVKKTSNVGTTHQTKDELVSSNVITLNRAIKKVQGSI